LFVASLPGLAATDFCICGATGLQCSPFGASGYMYITVMDGLRTDALGNIYLWNTPPTVIGTCTVDIGTYDVYEWPLYRVTPSGSVERVGSLREECHPDYITQFMSPAWGPYEIDATTGSLFVYVCVLNRTPSHGARTLCAT